MQILQRINNLWSIALRFKFSKSLPSLKQFVECLVSAYFKQNINKIMIFENVFELNNVLMMQWLVNLNFWNKLLTSSISGEWNLGDDFRSKDFVRFQIGYFIALRESAFTQQFTESILLDCDVTVYLWNFFLDDWRGFYLFELWGWFFFHLFCLLNGLIEF